MEYIPSTIYKYRPKIPVVKRMDFSENNLKHDGDAHSLVDVYDPVYFYVGP